MFQLIALILLTRVKDVSSVGMFTGIIGMVRSLSV